MGSHLASVGREFGSTTGRPRRCGWFDAHALRRVISINSISGLCITKLDVLDSLESISICVGYENPESDAPIPLYEKLPGWKEPTAKVREMKNLPANARAYLQRIESACEVKVDFVSTGPDRADTIILKEPFA